MLPTKLIMQPEGFYCEAAAGSAEEVFADKARQWSGSENQRGAYLLDEK